MAPDYWSPRPVEWFKGNRQDQDSGNGIGRGAPRSTAPRPSRSGPSRMLLTLRSKSARCWR